MAKQKVGSQAQEKKMMTSPAAPEKQTSLTHDAIARRAYELYRARGGEHGHHHEDWYQAERELKLGKQ